jgi:tRNA(Ile)-lysidine synthase
VDLIARVHQTIIREELLRPKEAVVVAVSGGLDSMALLEILQRLGQWKLHVAHFNHCLRGAESDADESFVRNAAQKLGLQFFTERGDIKAHAAEQGSSIEMAARELRYRFLHALADRVTAERIVLAHHADDQVETFWLRLLRGDVGPGLAGMRWKRPATANGHIQIVRPLLDVQKAELIEFARQNGIEFRDDSSNASIGFQRNRLRLEIIPQLEKFQPSLGQISWKAAEILSAEKQFLEASARAWLAQDAENFSSLHKALQREIVRVQLLDLGVKPTHELIETLRSSEITPASVSASQAILRDPDGRLRFKENHSLAFGDIEMSVDLRAHGSVAVGNARFEWRFVEKRGPAGLGVEYFDAAQIGPSGMIRQWQPGDRYQPIGLPASAKLQDLFTNAKIPADKKRHRLVATDHAGKIFWVEGLRISELHKVTPQTTRVLEWKWRHESEA